MALNNLERYAAVVDRTVFFRTLAEHPGAVPLLARLFGASQVLADALRRRPSNLAWLLEPATMRLWFAEDLAADLAQTLGPFEARAARMNALRRFKYRHLLRIGARDLLGDADLAMTTEELSHLADACLSEALRAADAGLREAYGAPSGPDGSPTGLAIVAMGKLGGDELNYSSDIDLMFVYGADGDTAGGRAGRLANGEYFTRVSREVVALVEEITDEGYAFRVDLRLRPEGRMGGIILSLDGYRTYYRERAELWERQALVKARIAAGDAGVGGRFMTLAAETVYRPGLDARIVGSIRDMKGQIDRAVRAKGHQATDVKLGRGGIREIEFIVQALQLLYGGDDAWLREPTTLKAIFRLTERGYLAPDLGRLLSQAYVHLRTVEHRLQILHEFQTHTLPTQTLELGRLARRAGVQAQPARAARQFQARHRAVTTAVHRAFRDFFSARELGPRRRIRLASLTALRATGFRDSERARHNLELILEGRPLVPYAAHLHATLERLYPMLLDALWKSPDPDEALNQFERLLAAAGPRAGLIELLVKDADLLLGLVKVCAGGDLLTELLIAQPELLASLASPERLLGRKPTAAVRASLASIFVPGATSAERRDRLRRQKQAEELSIVWRYVLGITTIDGYSREMTALAEATLAAGWGLAQESLIERYGVPRDAAGRFIPAVVVGLGKLGGRELVTGSDLDVFVVFGEDGTTDGREPIDAHWFYSLAVERLAGALGDITASGVAFPVDLRLRPGSKGSGFAASVAALEQYYLEHGDLWERQTLTRARLILGDRALARRVRAALRRLVYGAPLPRAALKEIVEVRTRMERELGKETRGRLHVKYGRGGLVDVEFLAQAMQLVHGHDHVEARQFSTRAALAGLARAGALAAPTAVGLAQRYRFLRRVSASLRLLGARPSDTLELAGPMPARVATALGYESRAAFLEAYREQTTAVRAMYDALRTTEERSQAAPASAHPRSEPGSRTPLQ
jgi:glutamate-ammonia-ligase adenylyltransferase